jgi:hypothetical protein
MCVYEWLLRVRMIELPRAGHPHAEERFVLLPCAGRGGDVLVGHCEPDSGRRDLIISARPAIRPQRGHYVAR